MKKFEIGKVYGITMMGHVGKLPAHTVKVVKRSAAYVTFLNCGAEKNGFTDETERVKIRQTDNGNEYAIIFGGIVSDSVYASDLI